MKKQSLDPVVTVDLDKFNPQQSIKRAKGNNAEPPKEKNLKGKKVASAKGATSAVPSLPKKLSDKIMSNLTKFNGSSDTGKPIYVSTDIVEKLNDISNKYHRRISVRAIARAVLESFINDFNGEEVIDEYMKKIGFIEPSKEELAEKKELADKARIRRQNK